MELQWLLAGPILRRTEPGQVCVWLATSEPAAISGEVLALGDHGRPLGTGVAETVRLGPRLFVHLVRIRPDDSDTGFPTDTLLAYDLVVDGERRLADLGLLDGPDRITYRDLPLPTFFIRERIEELNVLHGSCRKLHAGGEDALGTADALVHRFATDLEHRPGALFLTGDQIYADDVGGPLSRHITELGRELTGMVDDVPGLPPPGDIPVYARKELVHDRARFTSPDSPNHLIGFGEFCAMYVTAWNQRNWPNRLPSRRELDTDGRTGFGHRNHRGEIHALERTRAALPRVRRLLANTPTYMIFDDHDVTDDWNITADWRHDVESSPTGRRIVANALAAYWAFQGWGNDPDRVGDEIGRAVAGYVDGTTSPDDYEKALWSFDRWSFVAPTDPPALFLDTRTQRRYDAPEGGARLIDREGLQQEAELARSAGHRPGQPMIVVSAVPVCGLEIVERRQRYAVDAVGPYAIDFEAWHANLQGFVDLVRFLLDDLELPWAVMCSGDVHYGFTVNVTVDAEGRALPITQLVSSPLHHSGTTSRIALTTLGILSRERHERVGWDRPPALPKQEGLRRKILQRPSNADEWNPESPVFVSPKLAERLSVTDPPQYREWRDYAQIREARTSLIGLNNVGWLSLRNGVATHRLLTRQRGRIGTFTTVVDAKDDDSRGSGAASADEPVAPHVGEDRLGAR
jgi:hypothetical protein